MKSWRTDRLIQAGHATPDDPPEVVSALLDLRELGCHGTDMEAAADILRARPSIGEYLILADGKAQRARHRCLWGDVPEFTKARVVWIPPTEDAQ